jgi:hypothetical protein
MELRPLHTPSIQAEKSLKIRKVNVGIQLYGVPITYTFLSYEESANDMTTYFPIGRQVIYVVGSSTYVAYTDLPIIVYRPFQNIEVENKEKFLNLMEIIAKTMTDPKSTNFIGSMGNYGTVGPFRATGQWGSLSPADKLTYLPPQLAVPIYKSAGVQIQYVDAEPLMNPDRRVATLVNGVGPRQDQIRPLIDIVDQLFDHSPQADVTLTFYIKSGLMFYIEQFITRMIYDYDGKYLYFWNDTVGKIKYRILYGNIEFKLDPNFRKKIVEQFLLNYPNSNSVEIYILAIQPNVNFASILYYDNFNA